MRELIKKEVKRHLLIFILTVLIAALFQFFAAFGFYMNFQIFSDPNSFTGISTQQLKTLKSTIAFLSDPAKFLSGIFYSGAAVVIISAIILGILLWSEERKHNEAEFLFSSGASYRSIYLYKFCFGTVFFLIAILILGVFSIFSCKYAYGLITSNASVFASKGLKITAFVLPSFSFMLRGFLLYFLGIEIIFAISFVNAFVFFKKKGIVKALVPLFVYIFWGILWNYLFGYQNYITKEFRKGLLFTSATLWKYSYNTLYFSVQIVSSSEFFIAILLSVIVVLFALLLMDKIILLKDKI
jgi:hypothetical protein